MTRVVSHHPPLLRGAQNTRIRMSSVLISLEPISTHQTVACWPRASPPSPSVK